MNNKLAPEALQQVLARHFPSDANDWSQATDELRDMSRVAREMAGLDASKSLNFTVIATPAEWNRLGIEETIKFYGMLNAQQQQEFCSRFASVLALAA